MWTAGAIRQGSGETIVDCVDSSGNTFTYVIMTNHCGQPEPVYWV